MNIPVHDAALKLPKKKARVVKDAVEELFSRQVIDEPTKQRILVEVSEIPFDWRRLARYSFIAAMACVVIAISAALADHWLIALLASLFKLSWTLKAAACAAGAALLLTWGLRRRARHPGKLFSNEFIFFGGVLTIAASIGCLGKAFDNGSGHYSLLILLATLVYALLGFLLESKLIWAFSLLSLGGWFGAETGYMSGWGAYYLGMAYPLRFVLFGSMLSLASLLMAPRARLAAFFGVTRVFGLLYLLIALWILSIWGNYQGYEDWHNATHWELFHWSIYFAAVCIMCVYFGLRNDDGVLRGLGLTFLGINLYTKFFEFFWDGLHKAIFFAILGLTFWFIGSHAESIWQLRSLKQKIRAND